MARKSITLRLIQANGTELYLPKYNKLDVSIVRSDTGSISFDYPVNGKNSGLIAKDTEIKVLMGGTELRGCRYLLEDDNSDQATDEGKGRLVTWTGRTWVDAMMDSAIVFPPGMGNSGTWTSTSPNPGLSYVGASPGAILKDMIDRAKGRGCFPLLAYDFTGLVDSNGLAWPNATKLTKTYDVSSSYLSVLQDLRDLGFIEYEGVGRTLRVYVAGYGGSMERDFSLPGANRVILRKGRDLSSAPRQSSIRGVASQLLLQGENGTYAQVAAAAADTAFRREGFSSEGGIQDTATLTQIGQQRIQTLSKIGEQKTLQLASLANPKTPAPWSKYYVGDWIITRTGTNGAYSTDRVAQITLSVDEDGTANGSVVVNDLFSERAVNLLRRIDKIEAGYTVTGTGSSGSPSGLDATTPKAPAQVNLTTDSVQDSKGGSYGRITASWTAVVSNTDETPITDLGGYRIAWKKSSDANWSPASTTTPEDTQAVLAPLAMGVSYDVKVRAYDYTGHLSGWVTTTIVVSGDVNPPNQSYAPSVDATTLPGILRITVNGLDYLGAAMPSDLDHFEVHVSTVSGFAPSPATLRDTLPPGGGLSSVSGTPQVNYYVVIVAVDRVGNKSTPSAQATGMPRQVADGEVSGMTVGKLLAGILNVDITVAARVKTADTGARVELNATGIQAYNTGGVNTFSVLASDGSVSVVGGTISTSANTGTTTAKVVINPVNNTIEFHTGTSTQTAPGTLSGGVGAIGAYMGLRSPNIGLGTTFLNLIGPYGSNPNGLIWVSGGLWVVPITPVDVTLSSVGNALQIGQSSTLNLVADNNEIQARSNGAAGSLGLNLNGGNVNIGKTGSGSTFIKNTLDMNGGTIAGGPSITGGPTFSGGMTHTGFSVTATGDVGLGKSGFQTNFSGGITLPGGTTNPLVLSSVQSGGTTGNLFIGSGGQVQKITSSRRYKKYIKDLDKLFDPADILKMRPVTFQSKSTGNDIGVDDGDIAAGFGENRQHVGLIAEEVHDLGLTQFVLYDDEGRPDGIIYDRLGVALLAVVKDLSTRLEKLEAA